MRPSRPVRPSDAPETATAGSAPLTDAARRYPPTMFEKIDGLRAPPPREGDAAHSPRRQTCGPAHGQPRANADILTRRVREPVDARLAP
jgi:hypothetical protein